jgi:hypothetical protein
MASTLELIGVEGSGPFGPIALPARPSSDCSQIEEQLMAKLDSLPPELLARVAGLCDEPRELKHLLSVCKAFSALASGGANSLRWLCEAVVKHIGFESAVLKASKAGRADALKWILRAPEALGAATLSMQPALTVAAMAGNQAICEALVQHGVPLLTKRDCMALYCAAQGGHKDLIAFFLACLSDTVGAGG